jgi:hypothetical protein
MTADRPEAPGDRAALVLGAVALAFAVVFGIIASHAPPPASAVGQQEHHATSVDGR